MKKKQAIIFLSLLMFISCGKKEEDALTSGSSSSTELDSVPATTGEVVDSSASALVATRSMGSLSLRVAQSAATTGLVLSKADSNSFTSGDSTAMCENANLIKQVIGDAAQPDKIQCYVRAMRKTGVIPSSVDIASGDWVYLKLVNLPGEGGSASTEPVVKLKAVITDGRVSDFKMFGCFNGTSSSPAQSEYVSFELTSGSGSSVSKYSGSESGMTYGAQASASGSVNSSGQWTSKTLTGTNYFNDGSGNVFNMSLSLTQTASDLLLSAYRKGGFSGSTFEDKLYTKLQIIGDDKLETLAIGEGSSKYSIKFDFDGAGSTYSENAQSGIDSWNGDTKQNLSTASDGTYYSDVNSYDLNNITIPSSNTAITFSGDEVWDCTLPSGASFVDADFSSAGQEINTEMQSCEEKFGFGNDYIGCYNTY